MFWAPTDKLWTKHDESRGVAASQLSEACITVENPMHLLGAINKEWRPLLADRFNLEHDYKYCVVRYAIYIP